MLAKPRASFVVARWWSATVVELQLPVSAAHS